MAGRMNSIGEMSKELALVCCVIREEGLIPQTLWQSFDLIYDIAEAFVEQYPPKTEWGCENNQKEYDETIIDFTLDYLLTKNK